MNLLDLLTRSRIMFLVFGIVFLFSGIIINILQYILHVLVNPINKNLFRKINYYLNYSLFSEIVFVIQYWGNVKVKLHIKKSDFDNLFGKEHALIIMNHTYEIDWMVGWVFGENCNVLGNCKTFAKKSIQYIPTLGFAWKLGESIFLERNWEKDEIIFKTKLDNLLTYQDPFWILLAAEGTRFTPEKHEISKNFARKHGLVELRHHLTPRTKGFTTAIPHVRNKIPALYNINIGIRPGAVKPSIENVLMRKPICAELFVERFSINELPENDEKLAEWLHSLYKRKDDCLHSYLETGDWFQISNVEKVDSFFLRKRIFPLLNVIFWCLVTVIPLSKFFINLIITGNITYLAITIGFFALIMFFLNKMVGQTKISKASSYGTNNSAVKPKAN